MKAHERSDGEDLGRYLGKQRADIFLALVLHAFMQDNQQRGGTLMNSLAPQTFCCGKMPNRICLGHVELWGALESLKRTEAAMGEKGVD